MDNQEETPEDESTNTNKILLHYLSKKINDKKSTYNITKKRSVSQNQNQNQDSIKLGKLFNHAIITKI
jgi:hypothetical protein